MSPTDLSTAAARKQFGIYYTPDAAARILCEWAIRRSDDCVLEPSFGACGFLEASRDRLHELGAADPANQLSGCDVDARAFSEFLEPKFGFGTRDGRFLHKDFLRTTPKDFCTAAFRVVIGNPPYVSLHNMRLEQREARKAVFQGGLELDAKASLWAYFVLHACSFLEKGGRIAWILPSSFLHAEYAAKLRAQLAVRFSRGLIVQLGQRLFLSGGTDESTVVFLAEGWDSGTDSPNLRVEYAATLAELQERIDAWDCERTTVASSIERIGTALMSPDAAACLAEVEAANSVVMLGDIADIRIGIVTGSNPFFIVNDVIAAQKELPPYALMPILSKFAVAPGLRLTMDDIRAARVSGQRTLLVDTSNLENEPKRSSLRRYLASMERTTRRANQTFKKRVLWHRPDDGRVPDAFLPYMHHEGPRLVYNDVGVTSTNTIHRVYFRDRSVDVHAQLLWGVTLLSTFSQLSAEVEGRSYGAGVLKHEPGEAKRVRMILPSIDDPLELDRAVREIDSLLRVKMFPEARKLADRLTLRRMGTKMQSRIAATLERELREIRKRRHRPAPKLNP